MELGVFLELFASGHGPGANAGIRIVLDVRRAESPEWSLVLLGVSNRAVLLVLRFVPCYSPEFVSGHCPTNDHLQYYFPLPLFFFLEYDRGEEA